MASGSFALTRTGSTSSYITFKCTWSSSSNGSAANTSTVTVKVTATKSSSSTASTYGSQTTTATVDGASQSNTSSFNLNPGSTVTLLSKTYTVAHNADGSKSCTISVNVGGNIIYANGSKTVTLDNIPQYTSVKQSLTSKTETTATMQWSSDTTIDYIWYSTNGGSSWTGINVTDGKGGSYTIDGLSANTTYSIKTRVRSKSSQRTTDSSALSVTTYNYPYANSMPDFTIGSKVTIGLYNPLGRSVTVNIIGADNSQISNDTTTKTSISGYNGSTVVTRFYNSIPNAKSGTYKVKVTYGSQVSTKTGGKYTVNTSVCKPSVSTLTYQDTNSTTTAITQNDQLIIEEQSKVKFTASLDTTYGATISSCKVKVNGVTYNMSVSGTTATVNNVVIDSAINLSAVVTVTDSRGITGTRGVTVQMLEWSLPTALINIGRQSNYYSATDITVNADYSSLNNLNTIAIKCRYQEVGSSSWSSYVTLSDGVASTLTLDNTKAWTVQVQLTDKFGTTTYNATVDVGIPQVFFDRNLRSVGLNCFPQDSESLEINGVNYVNSMFFQVGDSITITNLQTVGMVTSNSETLRFSVILPKSMAMIDTIDVTTMKLNVRHPGGGYTLTNAFVSGGYNVLTDSTITVTVSQASDNAVTFNLAKSSAYNGDNNTPQAVSVESLQLGFRTNQV